MSLTLRSAILIAAALSASSVAPAQTAPSQEPLLPAGSTEVASVVVPTRLPALGEELSAGQADDRDSEDNNEATPAVSSGSDLPTLIAQLRSGDPGGEEMECLAAGIYFESKGEPVAGQLAVGQVISNRVASPRFPDSYCGVLKQAGQFSFVRGGHWPHVNRGSNAWQTAVAVAKIVDGDLKDSLAANALYFHARRVHPGWHRTQVASIGNHVFFR